jgi:uncharacterized protein (TIGR04255 family)
MWSAPVSETTKLPDFEDPPLIEVVHGVQFRPLNLSIVHPGQFYQRIADRYPRVETREPLAPMHEMFGPAAMAPMQRIEFMSPAELPRAWFLTHDAAHIVQFQKDRLLFNWRRIKDGAAYPRYKPTMEEFGRIYQEYKDFSTKNNLGPITPDQVEMTYISHFIFGNSKNNSPDPASILRIWSNTLGSEWSNPLEDVSFSTRYQIVGSDGAPIGRLYANLTTLLQPSGRRLLQLELTARGAPQTPDWNGVAMFLDIAHDHIVRCFAGITTPAAHAAWRRR